MIDFFKRIFKCLFNAKDCYSDNVMGDVPRIPKDLIEKFKKKE